MKRKVRKSILNRFKVTKTGKVMRRQAFRRHIKSSKSSKQLRNLKKVKELKGFYAKKVRKAVGKKVHKKGSKTI
jgi:large subunit ribosomal protein L35